MHIYLLIYLTLKNNDLMEFVYFFKILFKYFLNNFYLSVIFVFILINIDFGGFAMLFLRVFICLFYCYNYFYANTYIFK